MNILKSKKLLLIDGLGALLSVFLLGFLLPLFSEAFGLEKVVFHSLCAFAVFMAILSFSAFVFAGGKWRKALLFVAVGNFSYCVLTMVLLREFGNSLTPIGLAYFTGEIALIFALATWEFFVSRK